MSEEQLEQIAHHYAEENFSLQFMGYAEDAFYAGMKRVLNHPRDFGLTKIENYDD